jgi:hypothetical protein
MTNEIREQSSVASSCRREITTIEEFKNFLRELQSNASTSVEAALKAQLLMIQYVESSTLSDSAFDLLIENLRKALKYADSPTEKEILREKTQLIFHNYIFFLDAKLKYMADDRDKAARELLLQASEQIFDVAVSIVSLATAVKSGSIFSKINSQSLAAQLTKTFDRNFIQKICAYFSKTDNLINKYFELYRTLHLTFNKLERHRKVIGKSLIISELIYRWRGILVAKKSSGILGYFSKDEIGAFLFKDWSICAIVCLLLYFLLKYVGYDIAENKTILVTAVGIIMLNPLYLYLYGSVEHYLLDRKYRRLAESYYPSDDDL